VMGIAKAELGDLAGGALGVERALSLSGRHHWGLGDLALIRIAQGRDDEARSLHSEAAEWNERGGVCSMQAIVALALGDLDGALEGVERAIDDRDGVLAITNHWPRFHRMRAEPWFQELYREKMGY
ncbi:MAG: hypothetical protein VYE73_10380, partial [Acidobacteriota bacterium]|nr:hypothetical protein [Acidobacteriota bacterium]